MAAETAASTLLFSILTKSLPASQYGHLFHPTVYNILYPRQTQQNM